MNTIGKLPPIATVVSDSLAADVPASLPSVEEQGEWKRFAQGTRASIEPLTPGPLSFATLGPPALESSIEVPMVLTGLKPLAEYEVTLARPDRWDAASVLTRKVKLTADVRGEILFGEKDVRSLPGLRRRRLSGEEKAAASVIGAKLGERISLEALVRTQPELAERMKADQGAHVVRIVAEEVGGESRLGFEQSFITAPGVRIIESDPNTDRFVGQLHLPPGDPSSWGQPMVIWGGSGGTINADRARELASLGRPVLALKYFSYDPNDDAVKNGVLRAPLLRVPLEYFAGAIEKFLDRPDIGRSRGVSILGESRGAEAALLLAEHFGHLPITDVVAMRPLHFVVGSKINGPDTPPGPEVGSWTLRGEDIPFAPLPADKKQFSWAKELSDGKVGEHQGEALPIVELVRGFRKIEETAPSDAFFDLRMTKANVHLIGGTDDRMWQSGDAVRALAFQRPGLAMLVVGAGHYNEPGRRSTNVPEEIAFAVTPRPGGPMSDIGVLAADGGTPLHNAVLDVAYGAFVRALVTKEMPALFPEVVRVLEPKYAGR